MEKLIKILSKCLTFFIVYVILDVLIVKFIYPKGSYIQNINTPTNGNINTINILKEFNKLGNNEIVNFDSGVRPIFILEVDFGWVKYVENMLGLEKGQPLGVTVPFTFLCSIVIQKKLNPKVLKHVLIHEYLHCFRYFHSDEYYDIMYPTVHSTIGEKSYREYAQSLKKVMETQKKW